MAAGTNVTTTGNAPAPMLPDMEDETYIRDLVGSFVVSPESYGVYALNRMPSKPERDTLQKRNLVLATKRRPINGDAEKVRALKMIRALFRGYSSIASKEEPELVDLANGYLMHLQTLPIFALAGALHDIAHNRVKDIDPGFLPTTPQIIMAAGPYVEAAAIEQQKIDRILGSRVLLAGTTDNAMRKRIGEKLADLGRALRAGAPELQRERDDLRDRVASSAHDRGKREIYRDYSARGAEPVFAGTIPVSPSLMAKLGKPLKGKAKA